MALWHHKWYSACVVWCHVHNLCFEHNQLLISVTGWIYWFQYIRILQYFAVFFGIFQYLTVFSVSIWPVHSLQVMMSIYLIYFIILCFGIISVVKCLFAMSNVKGWERKYSLYRFKSPLLFPDWNCSQSLATNWNTFSFLIEIIYVGWNLIFKGAIRLVSVTYLVPLYCLVPWVN